MLLNLREEDRVPAGGRTAFQAALAASAQPLAVTRVQEACGAALRTLPVPAPRPAAVSGAWRVYTHLDALLDYGYVDGSGIDLDRPPPRLTLRRPYGRAESGSERPFWMTTADGADATDLRDRLGLARYAEGVHVFRISLAIDARPARTLFIPSALDSGAFPAWRRPPAHHTDPWGMTRHLVTDAPTEPELVTFPDEADGRAATHIGPVATPPPRDYLAHRLA